MILTTLRVIRIQSLMALIDVPIILFVLKWMDHKPISKMLRWLDKQ